MGQKTPWTLYAGGMRIDAEYFDCGSPGAAYGDDTPDVNTGTSALRPYAGVEVSEDNEFIKSTSFKFVDSSGAFITLDNGEWTRYSINVPVVYGEMWWEMRHSVLGGGGFKLIADSTNCADPAADGGLVLLDVAGVTAAWEAKTEPPYLPFTSRCWQTQRWASQNAFATPGEHFLTLCSKTNGFNVSYLDFTPYQPGHKLKVGPAVGGKAAAEAMAQAVMAVATAATAASTAAAAAARQQRLRQGQLHCPGRDDVPNRVSNFTRFLAQQQQQQRLSSVPPSYINFDDNQFFESCSNFDDDAASFNSYGNLNNGNHNGSGRRAASAHAPSHDHRQQRQQAPPPSSPLNPSSELQGRNQDAHRQPNGSDPSVIPVSMSPRWRTDDWYKMFGNNAATTLATVPVKIGSGTDELELSAAFVTTANGSPHRRSARELSRACQVHPHNCNRNSARRSPPHNLPSRCRHHTLPPQPVARHNRRAPLAGAARAKVVRIGVQRTSAALEAAHRAARPIYHDTDAAGGPPIADRRAELEVGISDSLATLAIGSFGSIGEQALGRKLLEAVATEGGEEDVGEDPEMPFGGGGV
ncbi:hypothetical protein JKP88DRAFT_279780 [Tribonema minus]|uniref:Uncharacterized protein n=1 Tax=Tribonema minus TaxID=303371 RepID=A0A835YSX8_9STRA|nr:hypothetical protein JKP88DRAFT_279780 [Tribonema minus]